jgi:hypothetical protein
MKHRGPGASLSPAREAVREQARRATSRPRPGTGGASPGTPNWSLVEDEDGALVAVHTPTGTRTVLANPPAERTD